MFLKGLVVPVSDPLKPSKKEQADIKKAPLGEALVNFFLFD